MKKNIFYIFLPLTLGALESLILNFGYFKLIDKPPFSPKAWLFPVVWSILYLIMGYTYNIIRKDNNKLAKIYFWIQLILNLMWSIIFFNLKLYLLSIIIIIILVMVVVLMLLEFIKTNKLSAYLNLPYLLWLLIALYLATGIYILN